ncbi:MAG: hypothetical protein HYV53_03645 [Parcubacteria group bacterium]|nr:hypothetical protein [Parcubacteria group bacterium]
MSERKFEQTISPNQEFLEQEVKKKSLETREVLGTLEKEKTDEHNVKEINLSGRGKFRKRKKTDEFIERHGEITKRKKKHTGRSVNSARPNKDQAHAANRYRQLQSELADFGASHISEWPKVLDLDTPLEEKNKIEPIGEIDLKSLDRIFSYLEGDLRISDRTKIERFGILKDGLERLKSLQLMSVAEATEAIRDFGLTPGAYSYLARRLEFYQKYISGEATRKVNTQKGDYKKQQYVDVVKKEVLDASQASPETIKLGVIRDIYFAAMQGTPEMGAVKVATNRINRGIERKKQAKGETSRSAQSPVKSVVQFHGYYSGVFKGSLGLYPELSQLYKECGQEINKRFADKGLDEKELEHKTVLLTARRLEGAFNYNGTLNTSASPYNAPFKESIIVGQLGHQVMRQMRGMRGKIQETNFRNVERFIGKSGDNRYGYEKKKLDKDVKTFEDFTFLEEHEQAEEAAELMTKQKNGEAIQRAKLWFGKETEKINRWLEKSKTKIAGYDITEEERDSISASVKNRYNKKVFDLQQEYQNEIARLQNRTPEELLRVLKERQTVVNKRFEKRKSLAQKALDLHFHFNHEGRHHNSKLFDQIDWVNDAPFGVIKRAHRALTAGVDDQTIMMRALAEVNGESADDQNPEKFIVNMLKSGNPIKVAQNFEKFSGITPDQHLNILLSIIESGCGREAVENLSKFTGITANDHLQIVQALNASGAGKTVVSNLEKFNGVKPEDKRDILFGVIKGGGGYQVAQNFEKYSDFFSEKDHRNIVLEIIKSGGGYYLNNKRVIDKFTGLEEGLRQVIIAGKYEALPHVLEAGFTIEEITRFPFLISPLVSKIMGKSFELNRASEEQTQSPQLKEKKLVIEQIFPKKEKVTRDNFESRLVRIDDLLSEVEQSTSGKCLLEEINNLCSEIDNGLENQKREVVGWPIERKRKEAVDSSASFVSNLLSMDESPIIRTLSACNLSTSEASLRRLAENDNDYIRIVIANNPDVSSAILDRISELSREQEVLEAVKSNKNVSMVTKYKIENQM